MIFMNTGSRARDQRPDDQTEDGEPHGKNGLTVQGHHTPALNSKSTEAALAYLMEADDPAHVTSKAIQVMRRSGISIGTGKNDFGQVVTTWDEDPDADHDRALAAIRAAMTPPPRSKVVHFLTLLRAGTKAKAETDLTMDLVFELYVPRLLPFPADIVKNVCLRWPDKWFPAISELEEAAQRMAAPRRIAERIVADRMAGRVSHGHPRMTTPPEPNRPDEATRAARAEMVAEFLGKHKPQE